MTLFFLWCCCEWNNTSKTFEISPKCDQIPLEVVDWHPGLCKDTLRELWDLSVQERIPGAHCVFCLHIAREQFEPLTVHCHVVWHFCTTKWLKHFKNVHCKRRFSFQLSNKELHHLKVSVFCFVSKVSVFCRRRTTCLITWCWEKSRVTFVFRHQRKIYFIQRTKHTKASIASTLHLTLLCDKRTQTWNLLHFHS